METIIYLLAAITSATLVITVILLLKIKNINYLLEQPIVKKMSPQLKLKPVKVDDAEEENKKNQHRNHQNQNPNNNPNRNNRPMNDKPAEGNGEPRRDFNNRNDRTPRHERPEGERPRNNNNDRFRDRDRNRDNRDGRENRDNRQDRNRNQRLEVFSNEKENHVEENVNGHKPAQPVASAPEAAPQNQQHISPLPSRRPLPSAISRDEEVKPSFAAAPAEDAVMVGQDDSDIQHGRRNQLKKKPVFADVKLEEVEAKATEGANV